MKHEGLGKILWPTVVDDAVDAAAESGESAEAAFEVFDLPASAQQRTEVTACGTAPDSDAVRVEMMRLGMPTNPADGRLHIMNLRRPGGLSRETIADTDRRDLARARHLDRSGGIANAITVDPTTAVDESDDRQGAFGARFLRQIKINRLLGVRIPGVGLVELQGDGVLGCEGADLLFLCGEVLRLGIEAEAQGKTEESWKHDPS